MTRTDIPFRLDRLPWSGWHWQLVIGLGITWILDGLEVTVVGAIGPRLGESVGLRLTPSEIGGTATAYLIGAVAGALIFGEATDRLGRKRLFLVTLGWYVLFTAASACAWDFWSFAIFRALTGMGIGGEYAAINSTIDELIPARRRGAVDLAINGTYWFGTILGSALSLVLLNPRFIDQRLGWRLAFASGAVLAFAILFVRRSLPESPRWLMTHGRLDEAEATTAEIEAAVVRSTATPLPAPDDRTIALGPSRTGLLTTLRAIVVSYPRRAALSLTLMITQAFLYNAIFFTQSLVLATFFHVPAGSVGLFIFPFALGNLLGPLVLGHWFDRFGRRRMIGATYAIASVLLGITVILFARGALDATSITAWWSVIFFFASAGASSAYLTVSEIFPVETRALAIALVYAIGTLVGGAFAPFIFGRLIETKSPGAVAIGYGVGAFAMAIGALAEAWIGVDAERAMLEDVAAPLATHVA